MRTYIPAALLLIVACPKIPPVNDTASGAPESSSGASTSPTSSASSTSSTTATGTSTTTTTTGGATGSATATAATTGDDCGGSFINFCPECPAGQLCVYEQLGDTGSSKCVPNPDGCVPSDPCSPECKALCPNLVCSKICGGLSCADPVTCWIAPEYCADGKCAPTDALGLGTWNGTHCVPLDPAPDKIGEPCTAEAGMTGVDSCEKMAFCRDGVCVAECTAYGDGACPLPDTVCVQYEPFVLMLCEPTCDPLLGDCLDGQVCVPISTQSENLFGCVLDKSGAEGQFLDPCAFINACDPGLACVFPSVLPDCAADRCCTPFCDITGPNTCPGAPQLSCLPWYTDPPAPPGLENVGVCAASP